jgi:RNA polymerase sigma-70 factor (ECF subfamily)
VAQEQALIQRILDGDLSAFQELIQQYQRLVMHIVSRMVANTHDREELCHEVFIKVHQYLPRFQSRAKLSTWIGKITYNLCINYLRKAKVPLYQDLESSDHNEEQYEISESIYGDVQTPEEISEQKDLALRLRKLIENLPTQYRAILTMYHMEELSYSEIAEITELPEGTVKSYLFRARKLLKEKIITHYQGEQLQP